MKYPAFLLRGCLVSILSFLLGCCLFTAGAQPTRTIYPGAVWPDKEGNHIQAHGGGIIKIGKDYYWYGEQRSQGLDMNFRYVSGYRSRDLVHWTFMGNVLQLTDPENLGLRWVLERPKVYYHKAAKSYVMYFHLDDARYKLARVGVAVSKKPEGPFTYVKSFRPLGYESRDIGQFIDDDGTPYLIFESRPSKGFYIAALSPDYKDVVKEVSFIQAPLEGGAIVHYKGLYYCIGSALTGWRPNPNKYATAASLSGPWSAFRDIAPSETNTYSSQSTMLWKVEGAKQTTVLYMGDQWKPATQWDSRYLWMPLQIGEGRLWLPKPQPFTLDVKTGEYKLIDTAPKVFRHPGILHSQEGLDHIYAVAQEKKMPEYGSYDLLKNLTTAQLVSPGKTTSFFINVSDRGQLHYMVRYKKKMAMDWSSLGVLVDGAAANEPVKMSVLDRHSADEYFSWPLGEDDIIQNTYNEFTLVCETESFAYKIIVRAYEGSIAFRYVLQGQGNGQIKKEITTFHLPGPYTLYQYNQESVFTPKGIDTMTNSCDLPATLTNGKFFLSIGEADNTGYTKAELKKAYTDPHSLQLYFPRDTAVSYEGDYQTPWRTISVSKTATGLHAFSQQYLKLCGSPVSAVPDWIKPGKLIRAQLTTESGLQCIDFAAAHHFQYIMYDAGWYGAEFRSSSDPAQVIPAIDMPKVIAYGKEKGIGVILYVNYVGLRARLDTILPLYKQWGVAGLKFGFVDGLTQKGLTWLSTAMRKVYEHGFVLNIHDNYKPTGLSRQFPPLLTQEGIRGDENSPDAFHNTVLPFTRFLAGPADFTFCYPNATNSYSKNVKVSKAQQLALTVVYFSPLQSIFWYGRPTEYTNEAEIEFFKYVPTVWNESHYLAGAIGRYISVARRKGDTWYVGNVAGPEAWKGTLTCRFLEKGKSYTATIYEDDENGSIRQRTMALKKGGKMPIAIEAKGGQAIIIRPNP